MHPHSKWPEGEALEWTYHRLSTLKVQDAAGAVEVEFERRNVQTRRVDDVAVALGNGNHLGPAALGKVEGGVVAHWRQRETVRGLKATLRKGNAPLPKPCTTTVLSPRPVVMPSLAHMSSCRNSSRIPDKRDK